MSIELKVKAAALAAEGRIIRLMSGAEKRAARALFERIEAIRSDNIAPHIKRLEKRRNAHLARCHNIQQHRVDRVKPAARATHLARMFLKGTPYKKVEASVRPFRKKVDWNMVAKMVRDYGPEPDARIVNQKLTEWASL